MKIIYIFVAPIFLFATCLYDIDISFDLKKHSLYAKAVVSGVDIGVIKSNKRVKNLKIENDRAYFDFDFIDKKSIESETIYLFGDWYPKIAPYCSYTLSTNLKKDYHTISSALKQKVEHLYIVSSNRLKKYTKNIDGIEVSLYFSQKNKNLQNIYMKKIAEYLTLYKQQIAEYPYSKFSVVQSVESVGYAMPSFTLVGDRLLQKDYLLNISLGHEILHQYFGSAIFNDHQKGNWTEGLVTYLADHQYQKNQHSYIEYKKSLLNDYFKETKKAEFAISKFVYKKDEVSAKIGYQKLAFVFHMIENRLGKKSFATLIKKFYKQNRFTEVNMKELKEFFVKNSILQNKFFDDWIDSTKYVDLKIKKLDSFYSKKGFTVFFRVSQKFSDLSFMLPVVVETEEGNKKLYTKIDKQNQIIKFVLPSEPKSIWFDREYELFRKLTNKESYPSISKLFSSDSLILVSNSGRVDKQIKRVFKNAKIIKADDFRYKSAKSSDVIFVGRENKIFKLLYPIQNLEKRYAFLKLLKHPYSSNRVMAVLARGKNSSRLSILKYYKKYSEIVLKKSVDKKTYHTVNGVGIIISNKPKFSKVSTKMSANGFINSVIDNQIFYLAESHNNISHHLNQLRVIKEIYRKNKNMAIAMEMFNQNSQKALDDYISGKTKLDRFLKESLYFKNWGYDYSLYKPIIDFAKENKIKIIGINIDRKINRRVSKVGLLDLDLKSKIALPKNIDTTNEKYRDRLGSIFAQHLDTKTTNFSDKKNFFYESQLVWDEIMSQNIAKYLKNKDTKLAVIIGSGHLLNHHGVPSRVYRRNGLNYIVVFNDPSLAKPDDYVIHNSRDIETKESLLLGVFTKNSYDMRITSIKDSSFASSIGLKKGDVITKIGDYKIDNIYDIKIALYMLGSFSGFDVEILRDGKSVVLKF
jgi:uncharacterized iron-regulated protein